MDLVDGVLPGGAEREQVHRGEVVLHQRPHLVEVPVLQGYLAHTKTLVWRFEFEKWYFTSDRTWCAVWDLWFGVWGL